VPSTQNWVEFGQAPANPLSLPPQHSVGQAVPSAHTCEGAVHSPSTKMPGALLIQQHAPSAPRASIGQQKGSVGLGVPSLVSTR